MVFSIFFKRLLFFTLFVYSLYLPPITILVTYVNQNRPSSYFIYRMSVRGKKRNQSIHPRLSMNEQQILQREGKLCIYFIFDLKRLSDSEFLISRGMFCQI